MPVLPLIAAALFALSLGVAAPATATGIGDIVYRLPDPAEEARARNLGRGLRCLVCQNESIEDSDAQLARNLRVLVREQIAAGASDEEVVRFVHSRYGDFVLLRPPVNLYTILLWGTPALALLGGIFAIWRIRRRDAGIGPTELSPEERARLDALQGDASR